MVQPPEGCGPQNTPVSRPHGTQIADSNPTDHHEWGGTEGSERVCAGGRGIDLKISTPLVGYSYSPNYRCVAKLEGRKNSLWICIIPPCIIPTVTPDGTTPLPNHFETVGPEGGGVGRLANVWFY